MARTKGFSIPNYTIPTDYKATKILRKITNKYDSKGFHAIISLDRLILHSRNGYFVHIKSEFFQELKEITAIEGNLLVNIIEYALDLGYYNNDIYQEHEIITNETLRDAFIKNCKNRQGYSKEITKICHLWGINRDDIIKRKKSYNIKNLKPRTKQIKSDKTTYQEKNDLDKKQFSEDIKYLWDYLPHDERTLIVIDSMFKNYSNNHGKNKLQFKVMQLEAILLRQNNITDYVEFVSNHLKEDTKPTNEPIKENESSITEEIEDSEQIEDKPKSKFWKWSK